jgi:hypothetical protein
MPTMPTVRAGRPRYEHEPYSIFLKLSQKTHFKSTKVSYLVKVVVWYGTVPIMKCMVERLYAFMDYDFLSLYRLCALHNLLRKTD